MVWYLPFHAQPVEGQDNVYDPSPFMLMVAVKSKTDYKALEYTADNNATKYQGTKPILVVCTDEYKMPNGQWQDIFDRQSPRRNVGPHVAFCGRRFYL